MILGGSPLGSAPIGAASHINAAATPGFSISPTAGHTAGAVTINVAYVGGAICPATMQISIQSGGGSVASWVQDTSGADGTGHFTFTAPSASGTPTVFLDAVTSTTQSYSNAAVVPGAPTIGTATDNGNDTVTVTFTANADNGGASVTSCTATGSLGDSKVGSGTSVIVPVSVVRRGLAQTWTVTQTNSVGTSSASSASNSVSTVRTSYIPAAISYTRTTSGLLLTEDWATGTGWSGTGWTVGSDPTLVASPRSPIILLAPTPGSPDAGGIREANWCVDSDGTWYMFHDGGDGTSGAGGAWRGHTAVSYNRGLNWIKLGPMGFGLQKTSNVGDGFYGIRSVAYVEKRGSVWYQHAISGGNTATHPTQQIPADPLQSDLWTSTTPANVNSWTFVRTIGVIGAPGSFNDLRSYIGCVVLDAGVYHGFMTVDDGSTPLSQLGRITASNPSFSDLAVVGTNWGTTKSNENPKMFYSAALAKYIQLTNVPDVGSGTADMGAVITGPSLTDWTTSTVRHVAQRKSSSEGAYTVGLSSPLYGPEAVVVQTALGYVPVAYDTDATGPDIGPSNNDIVVGRKLRYAVLEPSVKAAQYTFTSGTPVDRYSKTYAHTDLDLEFWAEMPTLTGSNGVGIDYRISGTTGDSYRLYVANTTPAGLLLQKSAGGAGGTPGTFSTIGTASGTQIAVAGVMHKVRLKVVGNLHQAWLDGELQINYTDSSSPYTSGASIALIATRASCQIRKLHIRTSDDVTVTGLTNGQTITLRAPGGIPLVTATVSGTSHTFTHAHYPAGSIEVNGNEFAPAAMIWGGDVYEVSASGIIFFNPPMSGQLGMGGNFQG